MEKSFATHELECVAVAVAFEVFEANQSHKNVVPFTDYQGVHGTLTRCWSENRIGNGLAKLICSREEGLHTLLWFERMPSSSNPGDAPSRGLTPGGSFMHKVACWQV